MNGQGSGASGSSIESTIRALCGSTVGEVLAFEQISETLEGATVARVKTAERSLVVRMHVTGEEFDIYPRFSRHFRSFDVPVAEVFAAIPEHRCLIVEDLGTSSLLDIVKEEQARGENLSPRLASLYRQALAKLLIMQIEAGRELIRLEGSRCIPFDRSKIADDIAYFRTFFLPHVEVRFAEARLIAEFDRLIDHLAVVPREFFYYRDLMTRNVMVRRESCYFIDFIGGRKGYIGCMTAPLEPSVLSLLNHSRANLTPESRAELLEFYLDEASRRVPIARDVFHARYHCFSILKLFQILGSYGKLGLVEGKQEFAKNIPAVVSELRYEMHGRQLPFDMPETAGVIDQLSVRAPASS